MKTFTIFAPLAVAFLAYTYGPGLPPNPEEITMAQYRNSAPASVGDLFFQDDLGVLVEVQPDQNNFAVTVKYRIIGDEKIFRVQEILTPTR